MQGMVLPAAHVIMGSIGAGWHRSQMQFDKEVRMVKGQTTRKARANTARRSKRPAAAARPAVPAAVPMTAVDAQARLALAQRGLQRTGRTAARLGRSCSREVMTAAQAMREPMQALWRTLRRAGRNMARDTAAAWRALVPATGRRHTGRKPA